MKRSQPSPHAFTEQPRVLLRGDYAVPRIILGAWQWSAGHDAAAVDPMTLFPALARLVDAGFDTFDCADIYTGVETLLGQFRRWHRRHGHDRALRVHTKFVPDRDHLASVDRTYVERIIDRSLTRLGVDSLDLVQFAWWDYAVPGYLEAAHWLAELHAAGKIRHLGMTNFDTAHVLELVAAGWQPISHQVQYSLLDRRPEHGMVDVCRTHGIGLLCYGSLAGGFLSARYMGAPDPGAALTNRSLIKYRLIIDEFGGWEAYQRLLAAAEAIAVKHRTSVSAVAMRAVLDKPNVASLIVGIRHDRHLEAMLDVARLSLAREDLACLDEVAAAAPGPGGDVYTLERTEARHARIMRYNLNREADA